MNKHHSRFRTVLHNAVNEDLLARNPYLKLRLKDTRTQRDFLTIDELNQIKEFDLRGNISLDKIRDFFLFSCYTGLLFNDALSLKMSDIKEGDEGVKLVSIKMYKTDDFYKKV